MIRTSQATGGDRVILEKVPRVGFYDRMLRHADSKMRCPEDVPLPSVVRGCLEYLGDGLGCRLIGLCNADRRLVEVIRQSRDRCTKAAEHIEWVLASAPGKEMS